MVLVVVCILSFITLALCIMFYILSSNEDEYFKYIEEINLDIDDLNNYEMGGKK